MPAPPSRPPRPKDWERCRQRQYRLWFGHRSTVGAMPTGRPFGGRSRDAGSRPASSYPRAFGAIFPGPEPLGQAGGREARSRLRRFARADFDRRLALVAVLPSTWWTQSFGPVALARDRPFFLVVPLTASDKPPNGGYSIASHASIRSCGQRNCRPTRSGRGKRPSLASRRTVLGVTPSILATERALKVTSAGDSGIRLRLIAMGSLSCGLL